MSLVAACAVCSVFSARKFDDAPAQSDTPWTCVRWADESSSARTAWAGAALGALRRKDGLPQASGQQVAAFTTGITTACELSPNDDLGVLAATVYLTSR